MTFETRKRKDDESLFLAIIEILFLGAFIGIDLFYSSLSLMPTALLVAVWVGKIAMAVCVVVSWVKFKDPNFDKFRVATVVLAVILALTIGIHHATAREDNQVIIDSHENAQKP